MYFDADGYKLVGTLHLPDTPQPPVIIGCHGLLANRHSQKQIRLASACNQIGVAYFRFDHRGCGASQGELSKVTSLAARRHDLYHAVKTMQHQYEVGPLVALFGSSFGGTVVLAYAAKYPGPALITYAAPINSSDIHHANIRDKNGVLPPQSLLADALEFDLAPILTSIRNIFVCHSTGDETVPLDHAHQIYQLAGDPKKRHFFPNGDHRMSDRVHRQHFETLFVHWIMRFL